MSGDDTARAVPTETAISTYVAYALKHPDLARAKAALVHSELRWVITSAMADWISLVIVAFVPIGVVASVATILPGIVNVLQDSIFNAKPRGGWSLAACST